MNKPDIFINQTLLPSKELTDREKTLLGFSERFDRIGKQLQLLLLEKEIEGWNKKHHNGCLKINNLAGEQYPLVIFHGDVGTGKTVTAECAANKIVSEARVQDSILFKLSNTVRGGGMVGEMGTLIANAFSQVRESAGKKRRSILIIDEGDSLGASRNQKHSHHEDKVAVNSLIQGIDDMRKFDGRCITFLCTNRHSALDPALVRRAAIIEEFKRPTDEERRQLFELDLDGLDLTDKQLSELVAATGVRDKLPSWTYSDIRTRLYPAAVAKAFPGEPLSIDHIMLAASEIKASPIMEDE